MLGQVIAGSDFIFVLLFGIEALMKIIVSGFWFNGPRSYLRDKWNVLDFFVLCVGIVFQFGSSFDQLKSLRALRALRCLKPLRLATRNKGLKVVITSLFQSIPPLLNVALVCLLFFLTFAILGISLLKVASFISNCLTELLQGEFYFCADENGQRLDASVIGQQIDKGWCLEGQHEINSSDYHSDINVFVPSYTLQHKCGQNLSVMAERCHFQMDQPYIAF